MLIRPFQECDLEKVWEIEQASFSLPWSKESLLAEGLKLPYAKVLVAEEDGILVGYIGLRFFEPEAEITNIAVSGDYRRKGIGQALMEEAKAYCREQNMATLFLEVRRSNGPAIALYEKKGFTFNGVRKDYYEMPREDAILMSCSLL